MKIHSILACDDKWGIARGDYMPWKLEKEYQYFMRMTSVSLTGRKNALVMGRKTWNEETEDGPTHPLPNRYSFILSKTLKELPAGAHGMASSLEELVALLESPEWKDKIGLVFNVGGGQIYKYIYDSEYCGRVYATKIQGDFDCDIFCPKLDGDSRFAKVAKSERYEDIIPDSVQEEHGIKWKVNIYEKVAKH